MCDFDNVHDVGIVAGGADDDRTIVVDTGFDEEAVASDKVAGVRTTHGDCAIHFSTVPAAASAVQGCIQAHGMLANVAAAANDTVSDESGDLGATTVRRGQRFIDLVLHHGGRCEIAIVAAEAGEQTSNVWRVCGHAGGKDFHELSTSAGDGLAVEAGYVFSPEHGPRAADRSSDRAFPLPDAPLCGEWQAVQPLP